ELLDARVEIENGELTTALRSLEAAERVGVAQQRPDILLEVRELVRPILERSAGSTREASERLARRLAEQLDGVAAAGVRETPGSRRLGFRPAPRELRAPA